MVFNSCGFLIFFLLVAGGVLQLPRGNVRKVGLLAASWCFYAFWDWRFVGLLALTALIHWLAGRINRRWSMWGAVCCSAGILAAFKYLGLWIDSIVMPIGISFYTFQAISYTVDVYKGKVDGRRSFWDVALYVSFFPQLISGPIVRAGDFFPQMEEHRRTNWDRIADGFGQFAFGFFKKVFIADRMAAYVGKVFENCNLFDGASLWVAAIAYTIQIYCDFSGYSDMAIGVARAIGFDYKKNFDHPYISTSVTEFWRRWHISLSTWLRDYIYIPLGGNRKGVVRQYVNLIVTMLVGGVWHGADWTFVAWGGLHGVALAVHKKFAQTFPMLGQFKIWIPCAWLLSMLTVMVGWILFRADTFGQAWTFASRMFAFGDGVSWVHPHVFVAILALGGASISVRRRYLSDIRDVRTPLGLFIVGSLFLLSIMYPAGSSSPFIYSQF